MGRTPPSDIYLAWEALIFQRVPWTTEESLRHWQPLYDRTWKDGIPVGDPEDSRLIIEAGWGFYMELRRWESALELAYQARNLFRFPEIDRDYLLWCQGLAELNLGFMDHLSDRLFELLELRRPYYTGPLHFVESLIADSILIRGPDEALPDKFKHAVLKFLEVKKRQRDHGLALKSKTYGDLLNVKLFRDQVERMTPHPNCSSGDL